MQHLSQAELDNLKKAVAKAAKLQAESKAIGLKLSELGDQCFEDGLIRAPNKSLARKALKELAKDHTADEDERLARQTYEEVLDSLRSALGYLVDAPAEGTEAEASVTQPLPEAARAAVTSDGQVLQAAPRKRGRPKGSSNKPKLVAGRDHQAPLSPPPALPDDAPIPDVPASAAA